MTKPGRNTLCPCGSGKKFKKCHGLPGQAGEVNFTAIPRDPRNSSAPQPIPERIDNWSPGEIRNIPNKLETLRWYCDELGEVSSKLDSSIDHLADFLEDDSRCRLISRKTIEEFISLRAVGIEEAFLNVDDFTRLATQSHTLLKATSIYWNEIDQRIYIYRSATYNLIAERTIAAINSLLDPLTLAAIARQVLEAALSATANQWVIHHCWKIMSSRLGGKNSVDATFLTWDGLERFCIGLVSWSEKHMKMMGDVLNLDIVRPDFASHYVNVNYEPTLSRQIAVARWYASSELLKGKQADTHLLAVLDVAEKNYKFLCKFVHPSPQMLELHHDKHTKAQIRVAVAVSAIEAIVAGIRIANELVFSDQLVTLRFQDVVEQNLYNYPGGRVISLYDEILPQILNKYKDVVLAGVDGEEVEIHRFGNASEAAQKIARTFDRMSNVRQNQVSEFIKKIDSKKSASNPDN